MTTPQLDVARSDVGGGPRPRPARVLRAALIALVAIPVLAILVYVVRAASPSAKADVPVGTVRDVPVLDGKLMRFSEDFARRVGLEAVPVRSMELSPLVKVTGTVNYDTHKFAAVGARIAGRVRRIFKVVGDRVRAHETLAELESAELGRAESHVRTRIPQQPADGREVAHPRCE